MTDQEPIDLDKERQLNKAIGKLANTEATPTDLWPSIKSQIEALEIGDSNVQAGTAANKIATRTNVDTKLFTPSWNSWAIAASLVLCVGSVSYSWLQLEKADAIYAELEHLQKQIDSNTGPIDQSVTSQTVNFESAAKAQDGFLPTNAVDDREVNAEYYIRQVDAMEKEFKAARASLMARISMNRANIDEALLTQIETELLEIEHATLVLKKAMGRQQVDANFTNLLRLTYQQELTVLTQIAKLDTTI